MKLDSSDWDILLPGETVKIGNKNLLIKPLGLSDLALLLRELKTVVKICSESGITLDNYEAHLWQLAEIIMSETPHILTLVTGIDSEDVSRLPVAIAMKILNVCLQVNIDSQGDLLKNSHALVDLVAQLISDRNQAVDSEA